jgi:hypothetical protein
MSWEFHVGQKVVCVDGKGVSLKTGHIYTIRLIYTGSAGFTFIAVKGVKEGSDRPGYFPHRFRPLEEKPDSIEQFRAIARGVSDGSPIVEDHEFRLPKPAPEKVRS